MRGLLLPSFTAGKPPSDAVVLVFGFDTCTSEQALANNRILKNFDDRLPLQLTSLERFCCGTSSPRSTASFRK